MLPYPSFISLWCNADVIYKLIRRKLTNSTGPVLSNETNQINILSHLTAHITATSPLPPTLFLNPLGQVNVLGLQEWLVHSLSDQLLKPYRLLYSYSTTCYEIFTITAKVTYSRMNCNISELCGIVLLFNIFCAHYSLTNLNL